MSSVHIFEVERLLLIIIIIIVIITTSLALSQDLMTRIVDLCFHIPSPSLPRVPKKSNHPSSVDNNVGNNDGDDNDSGGDGTTLEVVAQRWSAEPEVHDQSMMREDASTIRRFLCCLNGNIEDLCVESFNSLMAAGYSHEIGEWLDRPLNERATQSLQYLNFLESFHTFHDESPKEPVTSTKHFNRQDIVTVQRLKTAVQFVFPGELSKLAIEAGENSIDLLRSELVENVAMNHQDQDDDDEEEEVSMDFLLNDFKQYKAQQELRPHRPSVEGRNRAEQPPGQTQGDDDDEEEEEEEEEETEDEKNLSAVMYTLGCMTKLAFPVCAMGETLTRRIGQPTSLYAAVFLSSVFQ
jgi:hypothetical protein